MKSVLFSSAVLITGMGLGCNTAASPTAPSAPTSPTTVTFESQLYPQSVLSRTFVVTQAGSVSVTLTDVRPSSGIALGLGVGIPRADGGGCHSSQAINASAGSSPQLTMVADPGSYSVQISDVGALTDQVFFSVTIVHP